MADNAQVRASDGNTYYPSHPPFRMPFLKFLYRLDADVPEKETAVVGAPHKAGITRVVFPITGGTFEGPDLKGIILPGGSDWARRVNGTELTYVDAHYTLKTDDGEHLYIHSKGTFSPASPPSEGRIIDQDNCEFFTHITIEANGAGKYNHLNGLVCLGVLQSTPGKILIDVWRVTNLPSREARSIVALSSKM